MFVIDTSITLAWCFEDERTPASDALLGRFREEPAAVPPLWRWEVGNALLVAERRKRLTAADVEAFLRLLDRLPIQLDDDSSEECFGETLALARACKLTTYDAAYLELAKRRGIELATRDVELQEAARAEGVSVIAA